jgi:hypothetical protein
LKQEWCIPPQHSAEFVYHMEDVLDVYTRPYDPRRPLVCMDETPKQLVGETRVAIPARPGQVGRRDYEYVRNGVANVFLFFEPLVGKRRLKVTEHRTRIEWAQEVRELVDRIHPEAEKIVLVMDQLNTHSPASLYEAFVPAEAKRIADKLEIHYTPKHGSWLNMAEIELAALSRQCLARRIPNAEPLRREVAAWEAKRNAGTVKVNWRFRTPDARIKLRRLYPSLDG